MLVAASVTDAAAHGAKDLHIFSCKLSAMVVPSLSGRYSPASSHLTGWTEGSALLAQSLIV